MFVMVFDEIYARGHMVAFHIFIKILQVVGIVVMALGEPFLNNKVDYCYMDTQNEINIGF